jgi:hypothetical protein
VANAVRRELLGDVAIIAIVHAAACSLAIALGFDHVSDDDYSRVTIAQSFAHAPRLDPSGTSWLPFPFWALGSVMAIAGRSLGVARAASIAFASLAASLPYVAMRSSGAPRGRAMLAVGLATLSPWSLWLGAATVPESFTASFTAAAAIALGCESETRASVRGQIGFAIALLAACLSRYEAWPVAAVLAIVLATRALRPASTASTASMPRSRTLLVLAAIVAVGPLAWMAWNAHAHGDALHFFQRVARFKRAIGEGSPDTLTGLLLYPRLLVAMRPDVLFAIACAFALARTLVPSRPELLRRWRVPLVCAAAQIAFLAVGNARDGAPAHHAERALLGVVFIGAACAADVIARAPRRIAAVIAASWLVSGVLTLHPVPGSGGDDERKAQVAVGKRLREEAAEHVIVTPCAYEHFALIASYAAPERVEIRPATGSPVSPACPLVERQ